MDYTPAEQHAAARDAAALLRALLDGDAERQDLILDAAPRELRALAETLAHLCYGNTLKLHALTGLHAQLPGDALAIFAMDAPQLREVPGLSEDFTAKLDELQREFAAEEG